MDILKDYFHKCSRGVKMSYECISSGAFTDDDISAGVPAIICGYDYDEDAYELEQEIKELESEWYYNQQFEIEEYAVATNERNELYEEYLAREFRRKDETYKEYLEKNLAEIVKQKKTSVQQVKLKKEQEHIEELSKLAEKEAILRKEKKLKNISDITKLVAELNDNTSIQNKAIKKLFSINLKYMIGIYSKMELLTYDYVYIARQKNCINILIKSFLKKVAGYTLSTNLVETIDTFSQEIYKNDNKDIVYDRVYKIQKFIHNKVDEKNGELAHLNLPVKQIKDLLSASRLHLNLEDIKNEDIDFLISLIKQSENASIQESKHPEKVVLQDLGVSYIHYKRIRDMKSLMDFGYFDIQSKILDIANLDKNKSTDEFKKLVIKIYSDDNPYRFRKK